VCRYELKVLGQGFDEGANLVADAAVVGHGFVVGLRVFGEARGVFEADVNDAGAGEDRTGLVGAVADCDDDVEGCVEILRAFAGV
jgi:hypothetical protein